MNFVVVVMFDKTKKDPARKVLPGKQKHSFLGKG